MKTFFLIGGIVLIAAWVIALLTLTTHPAVHTLLAAGIISVAINFVLQQKRTANIGQHEANRGTADPMAKPAQKTGVTQVTEKPGIKG